MQPFGLYIHIPFCQGKCPYCDFYSVNFSAQTADKYTAHMCKQIAEKAKGDHKVVQTLYFGGGTPSALGTDRLLEIIFSARRHFLIQQPEITVEVNPTSAHHLDFSALRHVGVNRISLGVQSANTQELAVLGRKHTAQDAKQTAQDACRAGITNLSMDLMLGVPGQTKETLQASMDFCIASGAQHISCYILKIEKGTPYFYQKAQLDLPDEEEQAELYLFMCTYLEQMGFTQYEISNFSKPKMESRHNLNYWRCGEYLGLGPSAHSFINGRRFYTPQSFSAFYENRIVDDGPGGGEEEYMMLALRLREGLVFQEFEQKYKKPFPSHYIKNAQKYAKENLLTCDQKGIRLSQKGFLLSNALIAGVLWG